MGFVFTAQPDPAPGALPHSERPANWSELERRSTRAVALLIVSAFIDIVSALAGLFQVRLLTRIRDGNHFSDVEVAFNDLAIALLGFAQVAVFVAVVVFFCLWMLQAYRNVTATQPALVSYTPREAVASFFIPFVNLIRPYRAMKELYEASTKPGEASDGIVRTWWGSYLIMGFVGNFSARLALRAEATSELIASTWVTLAADAVSVLSALLAAYLVRRVSEGLITLAKASDRASAPDAVARSL
jgi:large-conductance mechanosensitive channel